MDAARKREVRMFWASLEEAATKRTAQELFPVDCTVLLLGYRYKYRFINVFVSADCDKLDFQKYQTAQEFPCSRLSGLRQ